MTVEIALPLYREAGGSLSILDNEGRHVAEMAWDYYDKWSQQIRKWTDAEIARNADLLVSAVNATLEAD